MTSTGKLLEPGGRVVGGVPEAAGAGLLATQAEVRTLEPRVEALDDQVAERTEGLDAARARVRASAEALEAAEANLHAQELSLLMAERDAEEAHEAELAQGRLRLETRPRRSSRPATRQWPTRCRRTCRSTAPSPRRRRGETGRARA